MKNIYIVVLLSLVVLFNGCKEDFLDGCSHTVPLLPLRAVFGEFGYVGCKWLA